MELSELSAKLEDILNKTGDEGIDLIFSVLIEICQDVDKANIFRTSQSSFNALRKNVAMGVSDSKELTMQGNRSRSLIFTEGLYSQDESWVRQDWKNLDTIKNLIEIDEETYNENDQLGKDDNAIIAKNEMDADNELMIPKESIEIPFGNGIQLSEEEQRKFKKLLTNAQHHYRCSEYKTAYDICLELSNDVENDSIQLQELLLISLFKLHGAQHIAIDFIENKGQIFFKIKLYAENIRKLIDQGEEQKQAMSSINPKQRSLPTAPNRKPMVDLRAGLNVRLICRLLINEVKKIYSEKFINGKKFNYIDQQETPGIRAFYTKVIQLSMYLYAIEPMASFFGLLMLEISGGGALNWLKSDQQFKLKTAEHIKIPLLDHEYNLLCVKYAPKAFDNKYNEEDFQRNASNKLLYTLRGKYIQMKKTKYKWKECWKAHQSCLNAFLIGYALYKDQKFLEKPLLELSGRASLSWLDINNSGELITSKECTATRFNSLGVLESISKAIEPGNILESVANHIALKKLKDLKKAYRSTPNLLSIKNNKPEIENLINIIKISQACYNRVKDIQFLDLSKEILRNDQKIIWINKIYFGGYHVQANAPFCFELKFDALKAIKEIEVLIQMHQQLKLTKEEDSDFQEMEIQIQYAEMDQNEANEPEQPSNEPEAGSLDGTNAPPGNSESGQAEHSQVEETELDENSTYINQIQTNED